MVVSEISDGDRLGETETLALREGINNELAGPRLMRERRFRRGFTHTHFHYPPFADENWSLFFLACLASKWRAGLEGCSGSPLMYK